MSHRKAPNLHHETKQVSSVVAVHGLGGDAVSSWRTSTKYSWLRDWLAKQACDACILSYGYDSALTWNGSESSVCDTALDLLQKLLLRPAKRFLFVCHGLGGVIVKVALAMSLTLPKHVYLRDQLLGLVFLGTPQGHLHADEWMRIVYRMAHVLLMGKPYRMTFMDNLERISNTLALLSFEYQVDLNHVPVLSYYETVPFADPGFVTVEPEAVILASAREQILPLNANHREIAAPDANTCGDRSQGYSSIAALIASETSQNIKVQSADLLQKLYCVDYELYSVCVPDASPRTGVWLWDNRTFQDWATSQQSRLFLVRALPGYGKTVLAKNLSRDLKNRVRPRNDLPNLADHTTLSYFFREDNSAGTSIVAFLRSILHQLLLQHPTLCSQVQQAFDSANNNAHTGRVLEPHLMASALWAAFRSVLHNRSLGKVVLVIDALDEADARDIPEICFGLLETLLSVDDQHRLKVLVTSRDSYTISQQLQSSNMVDTLDITPEHTHTDIEIFLENATAEFALEYNVPDSDIQQIRSQISLKSDGMFLWASLAWEHFKGGIALWSKGTVQERLKALGSLPPGLYALYVKLLQKIDKDVLKGLHAVFLIVAATARPLTCEEAEQVLGIKGWETRTTELDVPFSIRATVNLHCADLLKISPAGVIRAVHLSLKDFIRESLLKQQASALHSKIAQHCIHYLTLADVREAASEDIQRASAESCLMRYFAFYDYAATYLKYHMNRVDSDDNVWLQYGSMVKNYAAFHTAVEADHNSHINVEHLTAPAYYAETPLGHAIRLYGSALIRAFVSVSYDLDEKILYRSNSQVVEANTALHSYIDHQDVVAELLSCGASPNVTDYVKRTALHLAVLRGSRPTMKLLLALKTLNVNAQDAEGRTALHYEATSGHGSLLLNDSRVDVDIRDNNGRTAVTLAASLGDHQTTVDFLRSQRNAMAQHDGELSLLIAAAQQDWLDVTLEVLSQLSDVSAHRGYDGKTILHWAVINDWEEVMVRAILLARAKVNDYDSRKRTALHEAAEYGNFKLARKLIAHGASARYRDQQGRTPLQLAAIEGFSDTVLALMNSDFNVNDADQQRRTIAHWAASWDWPMIMRRVLEEPDVELLRHDCMGRTVLHIAALCGCPNVLKLLMNERVLNIDETDGVGNTLLHLSARARSSSVVDVLLNASSFNKAQAVNKYGQTALDVAIEYGAEEVTKQLRERRISEQKDVNWEIRNKVFYLRRPPQLKHDPSKENWSVVPYGREPEPPKVPKLEGGERRPSPPRSAEEYREGPEKRVRPESDVHIRPDREKRRTATREFPSRPLQRDSQPVYVKCHTRYLLPQTLDRYNLPWEWDVSVPSQCS